MYSQVFLKISPTLGFVYNFVLFLLCFHEILKTVVKLPWHRSKSEQRVFYILEEFLNHKLHFTTQTQSFFSTSWCEAWAIRCPDALNRNDLIVWAPQKHGLLGLPVCKMSSLSWAFLYWSFASISGLITKSLRTSFSLYNSFRVEYKSWMPWPPA